MWRRNDHKLLPLIWSWLFRVFLLLLLLLSPSAHLQRQWIDGGVARQQQQRRSVLLQQTGEHVAEFIGEWPNALNNRNADRAYFVPTDERRVSRQTQTGQIDCNAPWDGNCPPASYFDPALAGGIPGGAGIKARLNLRAFQYLSTIAAGILNYQIKRARLPNIQQCIPQVNGCINVYNLFVSRFRCPERVLVYPAPPNQIVLDVHNLDIGVTGNLGGKIVILIPIALFGIIQVNAHQVSVRVGVTIAAGPDGGPVIRMVSCAASVGFVDVFIQNGGLVGDIANAHFRGKISELVRQQIPGQLCQRLPGIIDQEVNSKISGQIPRLIPLSQLLQIALNAFGLENLLSGGQPTKRACPASCKHRKAAAALAASKASNNATVLALPPHSSQDKLVPQQPKQVAGRQTPPLGGKQQPPLKLVDGPEHPGGQALPRPIVPVNGMNGHHQQEQRKQHHQQNHQEAKQPNGHSQNGAKIVPITNSGRTPTQKQLAPFAPHAHRPTRDATAYELLAGNAAFSAARTRNDRATPSDSGRVAFVDPGENLCENCTDTGGEENPLAFLTTILQSMDLTKLTNIFLNIQLLQTYATNRDFTIEVNGGFSVCGRGCTPFGPFPMQFPPCVECKMAEILISDFSINSLLYHLHNTGFIRVRVGPETPKIGELLKTTCGESEDESGGTELEDHGVEVEEEGGASSSTAVSVTARKKVVAAVAVVAKKLKRRLKRQDAGDLASLGICLGDILPSVRDRFPNQRVYIIISSVRAPSVHISGLNGGTALVNAVLDAEFFIQATNQRAGAIRIDASIVFTILRQANRVAAHANITRLNLQDVGNQLGLPQDALDNLGTLGKDILLKAANDALEKGTALNIPSNIAGLPISIVSPELSFLEHAVLVGTDFTLNPNALGGYEPCDTTRTCCHRR